MKRSLRSNLGTANSTRLTNSQSSRTSSNTETISRFFTKLAKEDHNQSLYKDVVSETKPDECNGHSDSDFVSPPSVKKLAKIFVNAKLNSKKRTRTTRSSKTSLKSNNEEKKLMEIAKTSDVNMEHLQLAIALSKSLEPELVQAHDQELNEDESPYPSTQQITAKTRLELFGFRFHAKEKDIPGRTTSDNNKNKNKSKFRYTTPTLYLRADDDRRRIINEKISDILNSNENLETNNINNESLMPFSHALQQHFNENRECFNRSLQITKEIDNYYVKELNVDRSELICGSLLKNWASIAGRDKSPIRKPQIQDSEENLKQNDEIARERNDLLNIVEEYESCNEKMVGYTRKSEDLDGNIGDVLLATSKKPRIFDKFKKEIDCKRIPQDFVVSMHEEGTQESYTSSCSSNFSSVSQHRRNVLRSNRSISPDLFASSSDDEEDFQSNRLVTMAETPMKDSSGDHFNHKRTINTSLSCGSSATNSKNIKIAVGRTYTEEENLEDFESNCLVTTAETSMKDSSGDHFNHKRTINTSLSCAPSSTNCKKIEFSAGRTKTEEENRKNGNSGNNSFDISNDSYTKNAGKSKFGRCKSENLASTSLWSHLNANQTYQSLKLLKTINEETVEDTTIKNLPCISSSRNISSELQENLSLIIDDENTCGCDNYTDKNINKKYKMENYASASLMSNLNASVSKTPESDHTDFDNCEVDGKGIYYYESFCEFDDADKDRNSIISVDWEHNDTSLEEKDFQSKQTKVELKHSKQVPVFEESINKTSTDFRLELPNVVDQFINEKAKRKHSNLSGEDNEDCNDNLLQTNKKIKLQSEYEIEITNCNNNGESSTSAINDKTRTSLNVTEYVKDLLNSDSFVNDLKSVCLFDRENGNAESHSIEINISKPSSKADEVMEKQDWFAKDQNVKELSYNEEVVAVEAGNLQALNDVIDLSQDELENVDDAIRLNTTGELNVLNSAILDIPIDEFDDCIDLSQGCDDLDKENEDLSPNGKEISSLERRISSNSLSSSVTSQDSICISDEELNYSCMNTTNIPNTPIRTPQLQVMPTSSKFYTIKSKFAISDSEDERDDEDIRDKADENINVAELLAKLDAKRKRTPVVIDLEDSSSVSDDEDEELRKVLRISLEETNNTDREESQRKANNSLLVEVGDKTEINQVGPSNLKEKENNDDLSDKSKVLGITVSNYECISVGGDENVNTNENSTLRKPLYEENPLDQVSKDKFQELAMIDVNMENCQDIHPFNDDSLIQHTSLIGSPCSNSSTKENEPDEFDLMVNQSICKVFHKSLGQTKTKLQHPRVQELINTNHTATNNLHSLTKPQQVKSGNSFAFDDTFANLLEQTNVLNKIENLENQLIGTTPSPNDIDGIEGESCIKSPATPKTPQDGLYVKTVNITPMPVYDKMTTQQIHKELDKIGVKPLKRHQGIQVLKHVYNSMHLPLEQQDVNQDARERDLRPTKLCKKLNYNEDEHETDYIGLSRRHQKNEIIASQSEKLINKNSRQLVQEPVGRIDINPEISNCEPVEQMIFERRQSKRIASCALPFHIAWHNFLCVNRNIWENVLLYEPLQVEVLYAMFKELGFKYRIQDMIRFFDKKCITIRIKQNN